MSSSYKATNQDDVEASPREHEAAQEEVNARAPEGPVEPQDPERQRLLGGREFGIRPPISPDDPVVSPINLYKIRVLKTLLVIMFCINSVLFLALLLTDFVAIPGLNNRGKSFLELDLIAINVLTNLLTLWCFVVPAYYERVLGYLTAILLAIDLFITLAVTGMRDQFGLLGLVVLLWTLGNVVLNCFADYWVEKGKLYQEVKYTGRPETRKTISELFIISIKIIVKLMLLLIIWCISVTLWIQAFDTHEKPWGKMISVNNDQLKVHLACYGDVSSLYQASKYENPQPIVLVEGGQLTSSEVAQEWVEELYHLNKIDRYCIWDRPGYAFSDSAPSPISIGIITEYLLEALKKENIHGPFSVVGFDIGGLYARMFAARNTPEIHSVLLVDSWHEDLLKVRPFAGSNRKNEKKRVFRNILELMDPKTGLKLWLKGIVSPLGLVTNLHWFFHPKRYSSNSRIFGSDMYYQSKYLRARLQEQVTSSVLSYNEMEGADIRNLPVSVISSDTMIKNSLNWGKWQRELSKLSSNTVEWVVAKNAGHLIWKSPKGKVQLQKLLLRLIGGDDGNLD